ncbi:MAG: Protein RecA, partial [Candidatus Moranbacteria bacterium GW2011_GWD2_38_7]
MNCMAKEKKAPKEAVERMKNVDQKDIDKLVDDIQEKFGEGMIMKLGDVKRVDIEAIPTGSVSLDIATG